MNKKSEHPFELLKERIDELESNLSKERIKSANREKEYKKEIKNLETNLRKVSFDFKKLKSRIISIESDHRSTESRLDSRIETLNRKIK